MPSTPRPQTKPVALDGSTETEAIRIPPGTRRVALQPRGTNTVRVAFVDNDTQVPGGYFTLVSGQGFLFDTEVGFDGFELFFYAAAAETVDVVWW